jgi:hypothetical protein
MIRSVGGCEKNGRIICREVQISGHTRRRFADLSELIPAVRSNALSTAAFTHLTRGTVYTHLSIEPVKPARTLVSNRRSSAGNEDVPAKDVPEGVVGRLCDADPRSDLYIFGAKAIVSNPQAGT